MQLFFQNFKQMLACNVIQLVCLAYTRSVQFIKKQTMALLLCFNSKRLSIQISEQLKKNSNTVWFSQEFRPIPASIHLGMNPKSLEIYCHNEYIRSYSLPSIVVFMMVLKGDVWHILQYSPKGVQLDLNVVTMNARSYHLQCFHMQQ